MFTYSCEDDVLDQYPELPSLEASPDIVVSYPEVLMPYLLGVLQDALEDCAFTGDQKHNAQVIDYLMNKLTTEKQMYVPSTRLVLAAEMTDTTGTLAVPDLAAGFFGHRVLIPGLGSYLQFEFNAPAFSTYDYVLYALRSSSSPIVEIVDDTAGGLILGNRDLYASSTAYSKLTGTITLPAGVRRLRIVVAGKNPSSTGYSAYINGIALGVHYE